ncbi:gamma carbonic anhydrase family protein [Nesterenkonia alba]|uniref:gamma carbonic anhydrase family protein n=1 Tax=Nesterenkonia alba TaxID=515814 RepID=UPI00048C39C1|nr:gamma carbonic anhydrase family protein [Nesterenkonia alba]
MAYVLSVNGAVPQVGQRVFLAPSASITAEVSLGDDVSVFYGASVRGDTNRVVIGERTNLQDNVVVHVDAANPCHIGSGVSVGHGAVVHGCTIGDRTLVGMNATVLSGAVVGSQCLIAAGTVVPEGAQIPDRSLVMGVPGKVKRELSHEEIESLHANAERYLRLKEAHRQALNEHNQTSGPDHG